MLSSEIPPGSSCPSNPLALGTDGERQTHSFSIRDYVFAARSKDIATNWPFPQQFLQICLNRGINDVLPPFEPPDSVRAYNSCSKKVESDQPVACSGAENILEQFESLDIGNVAPVDEELCDINLGWPDQALYSLSEKNKQVDNDDISDDEASEDNTEAVSVVTSNDQIERIFRDHSLEATGSVSQSSSRLEAGNLCPDPSELEKLHHPSEKKCRLIVKFSATTEIRRAEDIASTSCTVSDSMASKVCPVCKVFASTSNTTLNAHIDQCLSSDCNIKLAETETPKPKLKPARKRLMVDIYATARRCTLEDLDRRNGTNWVNSGLNLRLNLMAPTNEVCTENKKAKIILSPADTGNDKTPADGREDGNEGAVYVDSNGIKLRILSKFNDAPPLMPREQFKPKEHVRNIKESKSMSLNKKSRFALKHSTYTKAKPQIKKLSTFDLFKGEIQAADEMDPNADTDQEKEDSPSEISTTPGQMKTSGSLSVRHWVCSKRSDLRKRLNLSDIHNLGKPVLRPRKTLPQNKQPDVSNSSTVKRNVLKLSRSPQNMASSPKTRRVDFLLNTVQVMDKEKCAMPSTVSSKCSSENASRSGIISEETNTVGQSDNSFDNLGPSGSSHSSVKATRSSTMKKDVLFDKQSRDDLTEKIFISLKFRKHRSSLRTGRKMPYNNVGVTRRAIAHCSLDARRTSKALETRSQHSQLISRSSTEETTDQESPSSSNISESEEEEESGRTINRHPDVDCHDIEMATSGMQVTCSARAAMASKSSSERRFSDSLSSDTLIPTDVSPSSSAKLDPKPTLDENVQSFHETDADFEVPVDMLYDDAVGKCSQDANESGLRPKADAGSSRYTECQAETASVQVSSACLTSHGDAVHEIPHDNSSATSVKITSDQDLNLAIDMEPTGSPISTTSTISPSAKGSSMKSTLHSESSSTMPCQGSIFSTERMNQEFIRSALPQLRKPDQFSGDQSYCCCSRVLKEPQFLRESIMEGMMMPSKGKQVSSSDTIGNPSMEPPAAKAPASADFRSPSPSPRTRTNSILRLMGKNLMVASNEEPEQAALVYQSAPDNLNTERLPPIIVGASRWENFPYHHQLPENFASSGLDQTIGNQQLALQSPSVQAGGFTGHLHADLMTKPDLQAYYNHPPVYYTNRMAAGSANIPAAIQGSNLMLQGQFLPSGVSSCFRPYSSACPRDYANSMMRGRALEGSDPSVPRPLVFQSQTNQPWPSLYYSPTLR